MDDKERYSLLAWQARTERRLGRSLNWSERQRLNELRREHGIPDRVCKYRKRIVDPTPEEIAERARECRERHFAQRRAEPDA
jgi:hypothetical protein